MTKFNRIICTVTAAWLVACGAESQEDPSEIAQAVGVATDYAVVSLSRADRDDASIAERFVRLVTAVYGSENAAEIRTSHAIVDVPGKVARERVDGEVANLSQVFTVYESADDSFEVFDNTQHKMAPEASDVSAAEALAVFSKAFNALVDNGLVSKKRASARDVVTREVRAAQGDQSGLHHSWVDEYAFFVPLKIGGVEVGTYERQYGVWLNVHRTGKVRRVQVVGASFLADDVGAIKEVSRVAQVARKVPAASAAGARFARASVKDIGLRYVVDEDAQAQSVVPRRLLQVVPETVGAGGKIVRSKAFVASHAINDGADAVHIWPEPGKLPPVPGDKRPQ